MTIFSLCHHFFFITVLSDRKQLKQEELKERLVIRRPKPKTKEDYQELLRVNCEKLDGEIRYEMKVLLPLFQINNGFDIGRSTDFSARRS